MLKVDFQKIGPMFPTATHTGSHSTWSKASFFKKDGERLHCTLCPHACRLSDGEVGFCQVRRRKGAELETATRSIAVRHFDPVEKKPFYHYRPGTQALTLAAPGCSFTCHYCLNWRLSQTGREKATEVEAMPADAAALAAEAASRGAAIALSYSEPSLAAELTLDLAREAAPLNVDILWKSNGFLTAEAIDTLTPFLKAVNIDLKAADERRHRALTGAPLAPVLETIARFVELGIWVEVSTPVVPRLNDDELSLRHMAGTLREIAGPSVPWHLIRAIPEYKLERSVPTPVDTLRRAVEIGRTEGLHHVYVERALGAESRATLCPSCNELVVRRGVWQTEEIRLVENACFRCGSPVSGLW
jgi:pyruvate formate lyase activating enzyme